jgi:hypothetical protein
MAGPNLTGNSVINESSLSILVTAQTNGRAIRGVRHPRRPLHD